MPRKNINVMKSDNSAKDFGLDFQVIGGSESRERNYRSPKTISAAARAAIDLFSLEGA